MSGLLASEIVTLCGGCGMPMDSDLPSWRESVNLTPDALFVEMQAFEFGEALVEIDHATDWHSLPCFGRWLFKAVAVLQPEARP